MSMNKGRKKICWITPDYFLCVDPFIVPHLTDQFDIDWIVINSLNTKIKIEEIESNTIKPKEYNLKYRGKDPRIIFQYIDFLLQIRKLKYDLIYISFHGFPFFFPLFLKLIDRNKVIFAVHNVRTPKGASNDRWMDRYQKYAFNRIRNFHVFSKYQLRIIKEIIPLKNHYYAPLALEDYGVSNVTPQNNVIRFLFFGYIKDYKGLDLLIRSFNEVYDSGIHHIELYIAGNCKNWEHYDSMIDNHPGIISRIEVVPIHEIPDLISSCHYMVLPYKDGAQSGVLTLAYQYNKPIIVSDIESFKQFVINGSTGFVFRSESTKSLSSALMEAISTHDGKYAALKENVRLFVEKELSIETILGLYRAFLNKCLEE